MLTPLTRIRSRVVASIAAVLLVATGIVAGVAPASAAPAGSVADPGRVAPMDVVPGSEVDLQIVVAGPTPLTHAGKDGVSRTIEAL